jgi:hypothetical protein
MDDDGRKRIAIGHLSDSGDLKIEFWFHIKDEAMPDINGVSTSFIKFGLHMNITNLL